jgi:hypothetical protein
MSDVTVALGEVASGGMYTVTNEEVRSRCKTEKWRKTKRKEKDKKTLTAFALSSPIISSQTIITNFLPDTKLGNAAARIEEAGVYDFVVSSLSM